MPLFLKEENRKKGEGSRRAYIVFHVSEEGCGHKVSRFGSIGLMGRVVFIDGRGFIELVEFEDIRLMYASIKAAADEG